jgi:hypothetical protein
MKRWMAWTVVAVLSIAANATDALPRSYGLYHDSAEDHGTAIVVTNLDDSEVQAQLSAFDAYGNEVASVDVLLAGFASEAVFLEVDSEVGGAWGLVRVETDGQVALAAWFGIEGQWWAVENVVGSLPSLRDLEYSGYWQTTDYANTTSRTTYLSLVNPYDEFVQGEIYLYNELGSLETTRSFGLDARTTAFVSLGDGVDVDDSTWGMVDIHCNAPILLVTEYLDVGGGLIDLDLVSSFYLVDP